MHVSLALSERTVTINQTIHETIALVIQKCAMLQDMLMISMNENMSEITVVICEDGQAHFSSLPLKLHIPKILPSIM